MGDAYRFEDNTRTHKENVYSEDLNKFIEVCPYSNYEKMQNFPMFTPRQDLTRFLTKVEIFKKVLDVQGSIVECGCLFGGGVMTWAQLSSIFEPFNHQRRIIGFDTFEGHIGLDDIDAGSPQAKEGGHAVNSKEIIELSAHLHDRNRPIGHIEKVELIKGDACETIPQYVKENPHMLISLLYLDFDIYKPTLSALRWFLPKMFNGSIIAFDEINSKRWPGETKAALECLPFRPELKRFPWGSTTSYLVVP